MAPNARLAPHNHNVIVATLRRVVCETQERAEQVRYQRFACALDVVSTILNLLRGSALAQRESRNRGACSLVNLRALPGRSTQHFRTGRGTCDRHSAQRLTFVRWPILQGGDSRLPGGCFPAAAQKVVLVVGRSVTTRGGQFSPSQGFRRSARG